MHTRFETKSCWLPCTCLPCNKEGAWLSFKWHPNDILLPCRPQFRSYERITKNFLNWVNWFFMLSATRSSFGWTYNSSPLLKPSRSTVSIPSSQFTSGATKDCFLENICSKKQILVADPGERPAPPPPPLFLDQTEAQRAEKKFLETLPSSYLRVWMTAARPPYLKAWIRHWILPRIFFSLRMAKNF